MHQRSRAFESAVLSAAILLSPSPGVARQSRASQERPPDGRSLVHEGPDAPAAPTAADATRPRESRPELVLQAATDEPQARLAFSPDGRLLAAMGVASSAVRLWEVSTGRLLREIAFGGVGLDSASFSRPLRFSADGRTVMTATAGALRRWDVATGAELPPAPLGVASDLTVAAFSADGRVLAGSALGTADAIRCWDASTGRALGSVDLEDSSAMPETLAVSADGSRVAAVGSSFEGSRKAFQATRGVSVWDAATGRSVGFLAAASASSGAPSIREAIAGVGFSGDGARVAARAGDSLTVWNAADGRVLSSARLGLPPLAPSDGLFVASLGRVEFSPDGRLVAVAGGDGAVRLVDAAAGTVVRSIGRHAGAVVATAFSPDGRLLASAGTDGGLRLDDVATGAEVRALRGAASPASEVAFAPDGSSIVTASSRAVDAWDAASGDFRRAVAIPPEFVRSRWSDSVGVRYLSPDGRRFVAGSSRDPAVAIWDVATGTERRRVALGPGKELASVAFSADGGALALVERKTATALATSAAPRTGPGAPTIARPDARKLLDEIAKNPKKANSKEFRELMDRMSKVAQSGDFAAMSRAMDDVGLTPEGMRPVDPGYAARVVGDDAGAPAHELGYPRLTMPVTQTTDLSSTRPAAALSPDGRYLALAPVIRAPVRVVEVATGREVCAIAPPGTVLVSALAWSPDAARLATAELAGGVGVTATQVRVESAVRVWDARSGALLATCAAPRSLPLSLAFSADGTALAAGGFDGAVVVWDAATGAERRRLTGHAGAVAALAFDPGGRFLLSGGVDGAARLWDPSTGELLATLVATRDAADWLVVTPDGLFDGSPGGWRRILWRFGGDTFQVAPVESFFGEYFRPGLLAELLAGRRPRAAADVSARDRRLPTVELALAAVPGAARTARVRVTVSDAPAGARDVRLFRNGSLVRVWRGDVLDGRAAATLDADVTLVAGANRLAAYAFNGDDVKSVDAELTVEGDAALRRAGTLRLLAIGVNAYANSEFDLRFAAPDANDFADELERQQHAIGAFASVEVVRLLDRDATKANVLAALARLAETSAPEDAVVVFFAGHGAARGDRFVLVPSDLGYDGPRAGLAGDALDAVFARGISDLELGRAVEAVDAGRMLLVVDACQSGRALESEDERRGPMNSKGLAQLAYDKGMYVLTAAQSYQAALEATELGHGLLTYALVEEGLKRGSADGAPRDGSVLLREWLDFATARVPALDTGSRGRMLVLGNGRPAGRPRQPQRPRVFYRREPEAPPLVVAKTEAK